jgi:hypothetical protein
LSSTLAGFSSSLQAFEQQHPQAKWQHLAKLQPTPSAAAGSGPEGTSSSSSSSSSEGHSLPQINVGQMYADAMELCRNIAAAVPLPLVCNNPSCENLAGPSEKAAAAKMFGGCRCRYCSAACQAADRRRHKKACRRMMAAGLMCR